MLYESMYDDGIARTEGQVSPIKVGDPLDTSSGMGPINSEKHYKHVMGLIESAGPDGARLVTGGSRPKVRNSRRVTGCARPYSPM